MVFSDCSRRISCRNDAFGTATTSSSDRRRRSRQRSPSPAHRAGPSTSTEPPPSASPAAAAAAAGGRFNGAAVIRLGDGRWARVDQLSESDFIRSASGLKPDTQVEPISVAYLLHNHDHNTVVVGFQLTSYRVQARRPHTHTHPFNGPFSGTTQVSRYQKGKPIWILLKQETVSGSGISWALCKSAPRSRQITTPAPHRSVFLQAG